MLGNITLSSIFISSILAPSSIFQISSNSNLFIIKSSYFSKLFFPVIHTSESSANQYIKVFNSIFSYSKALRVTSKPKCTETRDLELTRDKQFESLCLDFIKCKFSNCKSYKSGGAVECISCNLTFAFCIFESCNAKFGGSIYSTRSKKILINHTTIIDSRAERFGAIYSDSKRHEFSTNLTLSNISFSIGTIYIAGIRVETTQPNFQYVKFSSTFSPNFGAVWDWSTRPTTSIYNYCDFANVSSGTPGAGITLYHWLQNADITNCRFHKSNNNLVYPCFIYLYSSESEIKIEHCQFDLPYNLSIGERYGGNNITLNDNNYPS